MKNGSKFTITYTGLIYPEKQDSTILFGALSNLVKSGVIVPGNCEVRLYGNKIVCSSLPFPVRQFGKVSHAEAVKAQKESELLWLLDLNDPAEIGAIPGKIFEYLGARRPIIATGGVKGNVVDELLRETGAGWQATSVEEVERVLVGCYGEWERTGRVEYYGVGGERYTFREMTRKYVELLEQGDLE